MKIALAATGVFALLAVLVFAPATASSQFDPFGNACDSETQSSEVCQQKDNPVNPVAGNEGVLVTVLNVISFIVGVASVLMVMLGGFKYITSNGDSNAVSSAKNTILYALIGVAVFVSSQVIIRFVISKL